MSKTKVVNASRTKVVMPKWNVKKQPITPPAKAKAAPARVTQTTMPNINNLG